jgi:hypothetical protein
MGTSVSPCDSASDVSEEEDVEVHGGEGRGLHSFTIELNLSNSRTHS